MMQIGRRRGLGTETVEGSSLSLEGVDDVERGDGLSLRVLGVGDGVSDDVWRSEAKTPSVASSERRGKREGERTLKEDLKNTSGLLVDETGDSLDSSSSCESPDRGLGDTLDVVSQDLQRRKQKRVRSWVGCGEQR